VRVLLYKKKYILRSYFSGILFSGLIFQATALFAQVNLVLVLNGNPNATIIIAQEAPAYIRAAAVDLQWHIKLSTGATLPLITDRLASTIPEGHVKLAVGTSSLTKGKAYAEGLPFEEFMIKTDLPSQTIMMVANDGPDNPATHWAVSELLERIIGAKWLWPGELGTHVDKKSTVSTPGIFLRWRSGYDFRMFRKNAPGEVKKWLIHHRIATRRDFQENSNMRGWHEKYYTKFPGIFARTPDGSPYNSQWAIEFPKFRLTNLKYFSLMMEEYNLQGKPPVYTLYPTDGGLFDSKMIPGEDPKEVYYGNVPVTQPYLEFYKKFDNAVNGTTVQSRFDILAYSAYFAFPANYIFNGQNFNLWFVDRKNDMVNWKKWQATGARMYLRPNWWNRSSFGPDITYKKNGEMLNFAKDNGMAGFKIDGFKDNWALYGLNYYVLARQLYKNKTIEQIVAEYLAAFGDGTPEITAYFKQCMTNSDGFNQDFLDDISVGLELSEYADFTSVQAIPGMYPAVFRDSLKVTLDKASQKTSGIENQRVEWLRAGLKVTDIVCNYVIAGLNNPETLPDSELLINQIIEIETNYPYAITAKSFETVMRRKFLPINIVNKAKNLHYKYFRGCVYKPFSCTYAAPA